MPNLRVPRRHRTSLASRHRPQRTVGSQKRRADRQAVASWARIAGEPARRIVGTTTEGMKMRLVRSVAPSALGAILLLAAWPAWSDVTERASLDSTGALANAINIERFCPTLAPDGRFVVFGCDATNLALADTKSARNGCS